MLVTFKTVTNKVFNLELDPAETIGNVKKRIEAQENHPISLQKVIYAGKVLSDDKTVEELGVKEKDLMVLMVSKLKAAPSASSTSIAPAISTPETTENTLPSTIPSSAAAPTTTSVTSSTPAGVAPTGGEAFSGLATGSALQSAKASLMELGYSHHEVDRAMRAAFNNPDRAAEYLLTGIPDNITTQNAATPPAGQAPVRRTQTPANPPASANAPPPASQQSGYVNLFEQAAQQVQQQQPTAGGGGALGAAAGLSHLRNSPQMAQMRQLIQQNPQLLQPILQQMGANNPQLLQLIQQNPDAFLQMMAEGDGEEAEETSGPGGFGMPQVVHITPEEDAAINRLIALGFERANAIEAFLACDKNEELAANYLFDQMGGDDFQ